MKNKKLLMIPGPTPVVRRIQDQMARETVAFKDPEFVEDFKELIGDLKDLWKSSGEVFVVAGTGTMAMEMAIANSTKAGDRVLVVTHGYFGDRYTEICERKGLKVDVLSSEWGQIVPVKDIEEKLSTNDYKAVTVTHVDTSTGVCAPIQEIGDMMKNYPDTLYIVDGVCATAGELENMEEMNIDLLLTGSQKAFGVAPGMAIVWANDKAMERRKDLGTIPEYYIDFDKWLPIMQDPSKYFATPAINMIWAMKEAVEIIKEEGMENRYQRHHKNALALQKALESLGFKILAKKHCRAITLSNVIYPEGVEDAEFRSILAEEGMVVAGGLGPYADKMFRLGHMGNIDTHDMVSVLATIERALDRVGYPVEFGKSVGTYLSAVKGGK